jgi:hypothetical protein
LIPTDRADAVLLGVLLAVVAILVALAVSLATWGTPGWGSPAPVLRSLSGSQNLDDLVMNRAGYGFVAWEQRAGDGYRIFVARFLPDSGWGSGIPVDEGFANDHGKVASLAVSDNGDALVVWTNVGTPPTLWSSRFVAGRGWESAVLLRQDDNARSMQFATAMDGSGGGIVLWSQGEWDSAVGSEVGHLYARRFNLATGWEPPAAVGTGWATDVVLLDNGTAVGTWATTGGTFQMVGQQPALGPWSNPVVLNPNGSGSGGPRVCAAGDDHLLAVWQQWSDSRWSLWSSVYTPASGWKAAEAVPSISGDAIFGDLACTPRGDAVLLSIPPTQGNLGATWWDGTKGWSAPIPIDTPIAAHVDWPRVAVDDTGHAVAVWWQQGGGNHAFVSRFTKDSTSASGVHLESAGDAVGPLVATDSLGDILVAWNQGSGTDSRVWANRYLLPNSGLLRIPVLALSAVVTAAVAASYATARWWKRALRAAPRHPS